MFHKQGTGASKMLRVKVARLHYDTRHRILKLHLTLVPIIYLQYFTDSVLTK